MCSSEVKASAQGLVRPLGCCCNFYMEMGSGQLNTQVKVKVIQSCPTLCDSVDYTIHGILQARILESVAFPFSRGSSQSRDRTQVSRIAGGFFTS